MKTTFLNNHVSVVGAREAMTSSRSRIGMLLCGNNATLNILFGESVTAGSILGWRLPLNGGPLLLLVEDVGDLVTRRVSENSNAAGVNTNLEIFENI